jgi:hypothetical protein
MTCPYCGEPHTLSQCPRWKVPAWLVNLFCKKGTT